MHSEKIDYIYIPAATFKTDREHQCLDIKVEIIRVFQHSMVNVM